MTIAISTEGMISAGGGNGVSTPPAISNISPSGNLLPGQPGAFSASFSTARTTPLTFNITGIPSGCQISITVKFANRDEKFTALDFAGAWCWPFDVVGPSDNQIGALTPEPVSARLLPRGGWPPGQFIVEVAAAAKATTP
jgi:hypothetical protein